MTFGEMRQQLWDRLGITGEQLLVQRCLNRGKDRFITARKWPFLETDAAQVFSTSTRSYTLGTAVEHLVAVEDASGNPVERIDRNAYDELYRNSTSTGTAPKVYAVDGSISTTQAMRVHVWPSPSALNTGKIHYQVRVSDLGTTDTSNTYDHIPATHHFAVLDYAEAEFMNARDMQEKAMLAEQKAAQSVAQLANDLPQPQIEDGT